MFHYFVFQFVKLYFFFFLGTVKQVNKLFYFIQLTYYEKSLRTVLVFKRGVNNEGSQSKGRGFESRHCLVQCFPTSAPGTKSAPKTSIKCSQNIQV
jgi:hypothetical protein